MTGADLKAWRVRNGYSQKTLAKALGCTSTTISSYERGKYQVGRLFFLALAALENDLPPVGERNGSDDGENK